jgi:hypothetical protein
MNNEVFYNISKIIERDIKTTTYKFALLRGVIDIIQDNSPYISFLENRVHFPTGLLIPRYNGDVNEPRGGVIPNKQQY